MRTTISSLLTVGLLVGCTPSSSTTATAENPAQAKAEVKAAPDPAKALAPAGAAGAARETPLEIGATLASADVKMEGTDGVSRSLAEVATEKGTLVMFTCVHCPWAQAWEGRLAELGNAALAQGVGVIAINPNDPSENDSDGLPGMKERVAATQMKFPYVVDATSNVARAYGASKTPEVFLFDGEKKLVYYGAIDDNAKEPEKVEVHYLKDAIEALVAHKPITVPTSKAFGCSIKFRAPSS